MAAQQGPFTSQEERECWLRDVRRALCPPQMLLEPSGDINQNFFRPDAILVLNHPKWGAAEEARLCQGIAQHGLGAWSQIAAQHLPGWDETSVKYRTAALLGCSDLRAHAGWKGGAAEIRALRAQLGSGAVSGSALSGACAAAETQAARTASGVHGDDSQGEAGMG